MSITPKKLAIFYGWPSTINGSGGNIATAVSHFSAYDQVVFGAGLEDPGHADHNNTESIINDSGMSNTDCYGYVNAVSSALSIYLAVDRWHDMGVKGIFFDQFGYDFGVSRDKQNCIVDYVHYTELEAFVNAWNPDDVFSSAVNSGYNPQGIDCHMGADDWYLSESFQIVNGAYQDATFWKTKSDKMKTYYDSFSTKMACITTYDNSAYDQNKWDYAYYSAALYKFNTAGWGEQFYSASNSQMPFRTRKDILGTNFTSVIVETSTGVFERNTNIGISVDSNDHTTDTLLNM